MRKTTSFTWATKTFLTFSFMLILMALASNVEADAGHGKSKDILIFPKVMSFQNIPALGLPEKGHDQDW